MGNSQGNARGPQTAVQRLREGAERGDADDMFNLALLLWRCEEGLTKDVPAAVALFRQAAVLGNDKAMFNLAVLLASGEDGVTKDVPAAVALYRQAAERGNSKAMFNLALLLRRGEEGLTKDVPAALALYRQAAERGNSTAMNNLALLLESGEEGLTKDVPAAVALYRQAAERGNDKAMFNLALLLASGEDGVAKDVPAAVALYRQAAERGHADAMVNLALLSEYGIGTRRDVSGALELLERAVQTSPDWVNLTDLARLLVSEDVGALRNPARAAELLQEALRQSPTYGFGLHELAVLYGAGDDGVPQDKHEAARLHSMATSKATYERIHARRSSKVIIEAGEKYVEAVEEIIKTGCVKPKTCLLLTLGGGGRGKTCTVNSLRGMPFVQRHIPTKMAELNKFVLEPGDRGLSEDIIAEFDFKENSLIANASRLGNEVLVPRGSVQSRSQSVRASGALELAEPERSDNGVTERPHADVIERVRRSLVQTRFPVGFKGSVVQVWDMAGQSQYEMAHSMVIARGSILVFVTDLERVADEDTRESEVWLLCYWIQLARILVRDASGTRVVVVGTRKDKCKEGTLGILKGELKKQLAAKVYNSWIRSRESDGSSAGIQKFIAIENGDALDKPESSGLEELERAVKAAGDAVVASRDVVPLRWLALVDKLEREQQSSARIYFSREDVRKVCVRFPGYADEEGEKERDVLEGLRCFASMGRLVLFERGDEEWYVFMEVGKMIEILGKVTAPEEGLRDGLSAEDAVGLDEGRISQSGLFSLWDGYEDEDKRLMLRLLCQFDLLMVLEGGEASIEKGCATVGVPALMSYGWDDMKWGRAPGEKDLEVTTQFKEAIPNGLVGFLIAYVHRTMVVEDVNDEGGTGASVTVRADAALVKVRDGSRVFVGFKGAKRQLCWRFRGLEPVRLAQECIRQVEGLLNNTSRLMAISHKHVVILDCDSAEEGCGAAKAVKI